MAIADRLGILDAGAVGQLAQPRRAQSLCLSKTCGPDPTRTPNCQYVAALVGTSPSTLRYSCRATNGKWVRSSWTTRWFPQAFKGVMEQLQYAVKTGAEPELNASDNLKTMALIEAAYRSLDEKRSMKLAEFGVSNDHQVSWTPDLGPSAKV